MLHYQGVINDHCCLGTHAIMLERQLAGVRVFLSLRFSLCTLHRICKFQVAFEINFVINNTTLCKRFNPFKSIRIPQCLCNAQVSRARSTLFSDARSQIDIAVSKQYVKLYSSTRFGKTGQPHLYTARKNK